MTRKLSVALATVCLALLVTAPARPDSVPTFAAVTGHEFGERITVHHEMAAYLDALAATSPRVQVIDQGTSWEGRRLPLAIVTSPDNHARLEAIRAAAASLEDPRQLGDEAFERLLADQPAIVWMGGSIHGFELSGSEGLLKLLEALATADDPETLKALDALVVLIDPMINPDGRDAFAQLNHQRLGRAPNPRRADWNNDFERWDALRFRTGHYFFDTNRDWFAHTQAETRARVPTIRAWRPQVVIDAHEMGSDVEFFFDPATEPFGRHFPPFARQWFDRFNQAYVAAFDGRGFEYMTGERYNYFYPGYTTSWGSYQGAVGMLYEQGSSRGLAIHRPDDSVRTLADALEQQYTAARTAVDLAARERETLLREYREAHRAAIDAGDAVYFIGPGGDPGHRRELIALLARNGIEVGQLAEDARLEGLRDRHGAPTAPRVLAAGTAVVDTAQPRGALATVLLAPQIPLAPEFLAEARIRLDRGENPRFYDITAWSLPMLFDLDVVSATGRRGGLNVASLEAAAPPASVERDARYAYLLDGRDARSVGVLAALVRDGRRASVTLVDTEVEGGVVPRGSVVVRVGQNRDDIGAVVRRAAAEAGVAVRGVGTGAAPRGLPALGSADVVPVRRPEIAILAEAPVDAYSFGWTWYVLEQQYGLATTVLRSASLGGIDLADFESLVVPDLVDAEALAHTLGEDGVARLERWIADGGALVVVAGAVDFARSHLGLDGIRSWYEPASAAGEEEENATPARRFPVPGALVRTEVDDSAWLTAGSGVETPFLVHSSRIYVPVEGPPDAGRRVVVRVAEESPVLSGHVWPESLDRLAGAVLVYEQRVGRGRIVAFAEDPSFRGYWRGVDRLFLNAVVLGPSAP